MNESQIKIVKKRIDWIDTARALLMILVVFGHSIRPGHVQAFIMSFAIPCFFIISGLIFEKKDLKCDFVYRFKRFLIPYYFFGVVSVLIYCFIGKYIFSYMNLKISDTSFFPNFLGLLYANGRSKYMKWNTPLYYLPLCFSTGIIVNFLENIIYKRNNGNYLRVCYIIIGFFITYILLKNKKYIFLPLFIEEAIFCSSLMELGVISKKILTAEFNRGRLLIYSLAMFICGYFVAISNIPYGFHKFVLGNNYFVFVINCLFLSIALLFFAKGIKSNKYISIVGTNTIGIMCMHKFPTIFFTSFIPFFHNSIIETNANISLKILAALIITIISIVLCLICIYNIMMICPNILGERKKKNIFKDNLKTE